MCKNNESGSLKAVTGGCKEKQMGRGGGAGGNKDRDNLIEVIKVKRGDEIGDTFGNEEGVNGLTKGNQEVTTLDDMKESLGSLSAEGADLGIRCAVVKSGPSSPCVG